jgi:hypothetical protein
MAAGPAGGGGASRGRLGPIQAAFCHGLLVVSSLSRPRSLLPQKKKKPFPGRSFEGPLLTSRAPVSKAKKKNLPSSSDRYVRSQLMALSTHTMDPAGDVSSRGRICCEAHITEPTSRSARPTTLPTSAASAQGTPARLQLCACVFGT